MKVPTGIDLVEHVVAAEPTEFRRSPGSGSVRGQGVWLRKIAAARISRARAGRTGT